MKEIDADKIKLLLKKGDTPRASKIKVDTSERTLTVWFKLSSSFGICDNPNCPDDRPRKIQEGNAMVTNIDGKLMCRFCFVGGYGQ